MTHDELMQLPENGGFDFEETIIDGHKIKRPVARPAFALFHKPDDPFVIWDAFGDAWSIGWANGKRYRSRF